jgi:hypothetical protein
LCTPLANCVTRCAQIYSSGGLLCTPANCATSSVHKCARGIGGCAHRPANRAIGSVHKGAQGTAGCAHRQTIVRRLVCTNLLQWWAIVHTSQSCNERCAQMRSGDRRLCTPARRTMERCAQQRSGSWLLCTPVANYAMSGVHKSTPAAGYCAHQPIVQRAVCTNALGG